MNFHQKFQIEKQLLIEQQWMFNKFIIKHPSLFYQHIIFYLYFYA